MLHNQDKELPVSATLLEAHYIVRTAAEPWTAGDSVKAGINRAARALSLSYRRARTFWYLSPGAVRADEMDHLRSRARELLAQRMRRLDAEREIIAARLAELESTHDAVVLGVARKKMDSDRPASARQGRGLPEKTARSVVPRDRTAA